MASTTARSSDLGVRSGDRIVAIAEVGRSSISIHGYGTYRCRTAGEVPDALVRRVHAGVEAADAVHHDFGPWLSVVCAPMPAARAARTADRLHAAEARRRTTHPADRARRLARGVHREREIVLERGGVIDADECVLVMRVDAFIDYASGVTVTMATR